MPVNTLFLISWFALPNKQTTKFLIHPHQRIISTKVPFVILLSSLRRPILGVSFTIKRLGAEQKSIEKPERGPIFGTEAHYSSLEAVLFLLFHLHTFIKEH
uniref:Uncharacterized protein n=1 Tax=Salix viminalis TaxID=40686 RepID=A0A6N2LP33_SALVM